MKKTAETLTDIILSMRTRSNQQVALKYKPKNTLLSEWKSVTWSEYYQQIEQGGLSLLHLGVKAQDKIAIFSSTCLQWSVSDYAILGVGAVTVPIYQTMTPEDLEFILTDSQSKILFVEDPTLLKTFAQVQLRCPLVEKVILYQGDDKTEFPVPVIPWKNFLEINKAAESPFTSQVFVDHCSRSQIDDTATILYTSGTTGTPKGVVLTHRQAVSEVHDAFTYMGGTASDVSLTFLPYAHVLGRLEHWGHAYVGFTMAYAESIEKIRSNLVEIRPTLMISVPRIFEKIYTAVWAQIKSNFVSNQLFSWALSIGIKVGEYRLQHKAIPMVLVAQYTLAKKLALHKVTDLFGGRLRFAISGGAAIAKDIAIFFHACDVLILEGYGLTETTGAITVNAPFDYAFGSVGKPFGDVQLKIAQDGEILVKSDKVMREYYKNPEATAQAIVDGWFHTGDIGHLTAAGDLHITDRKKDLIKTSGGKYVAPQHLENLLKVHDCISHVLIHGDQRKFIVALLTLDKGNVLRFAREHNLPQTNYEALTQNPQVLDWVRKSVSETNQHLASYETIKRFAILPEDFTVESGELTPSLKVKRKVLDKKYKKEIESLYQ